MHQALTLKKGYYRGEILTIVLLLIVFIVVNLATSSKLPSVWLDEVMFTDPAANLYFGNGFTSSAWFLQSKSEFWAGNVPLHSIILYHWMRLFGFSIVAVRSINYVFIALSGLMLWLSVTRLKLVNSRWSRIVLITLFLLGKGITFNYRSGRYDSLTIFLCVAVLLIYSVEFIWLRCILLTCIGILFPLAGLQTIPYLIILSCLLVLYVGRGIIQESVSLLTGSVIGISFIYILYSTNQVWETFLRSVQYFSVYNQNASSLTTEIFDSLGNILKTFFQDVSSLVILLLALCIAVYQITNSKFKWRSPLSFGLVLFFLLNVLIPVMRNGYVPYYSWMSFIPLTICTCSLIDEFMKTQRIRAIRLSILFMLVLACLAGLPKDLVQIFHDWKGRDYTQVENLIQQTVTKNDVVYSDFSGFYSLKRRDIPVVFPNYLRIISQEEKQKISVLIFDPRNENRLPFNPGFDKVVSQLGGEWYDTGYGLENRGYYLRVFRRKGQKASSGINEDAKT